MGMNLGKDSYLLKNPEKLKQYRRLLNTKLYSVSSTSLSYRQINSLENNDILRSNRKSKNDWRKFSIKECVFLLTIKELRNYGLKDKQLKKLRDAFFKKCNELDSDLAIIEALEENKVVLLIDNKSEVSFYGLIHLEENYTSFININLNEIINNFRQEIGSKRMSYITTADILIEMVPSEKERKVIKAIRTGNHGSINIELSNNKKETEKITKIKAITHRKLKEGESLTKTAKEPNRKITTFSNNNGDIGIQIEEEIK